MNFPDFRVDIGISIPTGEDVLFSVNGRWQGKSEALPWGSDPATRVK
jgi:hypothetical protein